MPQKVLLARLLAFLLLDVLAQVMQMCKDSLGCEAYVRLVEAALEPMCVVTTDQQLLYIE